MDLTGRPLQNNKPRYLNELTVKKINLTANHNFSSIPGKMTMQFWNSFGTAVSAVSGMTQMILLRRSTLATANGIDVVSNEWRDVFSGDFLKECDADTAAQDRLLATACKAWIAVGAGLEEPV